MRALLLVCFLFGCDNAEYENAVLRAELNERIRLQCIPETERSSVMVAWHRGQLVCQHITPTDYRVKGKPHIDVEPRLVAEKKEMEP